MTTAAIRWEIALEAECNRARRDGLGWVTRTHAPVRVLGARVDGFVGAWVGVGGPDFVGVLRGGQALAFDAKHTALARFGFSNIPRHQALDLGAVSRHGGVAGIALKMENGQYWVPWRTIEDAWHACHAGTARRGDSSLTVDWLAGNALAFNRLFDVFEETS